MLGNSNDTLPRMRDSFFDDDDGDDNNNNNPTPRAPPLISSIKIVTSKPPIYRRQSQSSSSPSPSSCCSDHDVTDVSSMGGGDHHHHQLPSKQQDSRQRHSDYDQHHPFHLQSMRHVLLGSSAPTSRPPSPANHQPQSNKKHVRIVTDDTDQNHHHQHRHQNSHHQQPYIHGHAKDYRRVRLTSSAINRQKQQQKIERENMKLLERLQQTRASRGLKREELLSHYDNQVGYVTYTIPPAPERTRLPPRPSSAVMTTSTIPSSQKKSNIHSRPSSASHPINSNRIRSRPTSATSSVHGSSRSSSARRPVWNDRWQQQE